MKDLRDLVHNQYKIIVGLGINVFSVGNFMVFFWDYLSVSFSHEFLVSSLHWFFLFNQ